jgi:hypothetical protein
MLLLLKFLLLLPLLLLMLLTATAATALRLCASFPSSVRDNMRPVPVDTNFSEQSDT